jgi:hypothetical protein
MPIDPTCASPPANRDLPIRWEPAAKLLEPAIEASGVRAAHAIRRKSRALLVAGVIWGLAIVCAMSLLTLRSVTPEDPGHVGPRWPQGSALLLDRDRPSLFMFVHPRCACSRASVRELERLVAKVHGEVATTVVFIERGAASSVERGDLWQLVVAIPGVRAVVDPEGREGDRFGVATSGHTVLFGADGDLLYSGGLTSARGHEGDSIGSDALRDLIHEHAGAHVSAPVFGCPLTAR